MPSAEKGGEVIGADGLFFLLGDGDRPGVVEPELQVLEFQELHIGHARYFQERDVELLGQDADLTDKGAWLDQFGGGVGPGEFSLGLGLMANSSRSISTKRARLHSSK